MKSAVVDYLGASTLRRRLVSGSTWAIGGQDRGSRDRPRHQRRADAPAHQAGVRRLLVGIQHKEVIEYAYVLGTGVDFSSGRVHPAAQPFISATHPLSSQFVD